MAVAVAIALMFQLRCVHPPSGAVAITAVFGGPAVQALGFGFVVAPVAINSALLLLTALAFNNLMQRRYPHRPPEPPSQHLTKDSCFSALRDITRRLGEKIASGFALHLKMSCGALVCERGKCRFDFDAAA